jgi:hypothetical protein
MTRTGTRADHQIWATVSGTRKQDLQADIASLVRWGVAAIEFRMDLVPQNLWETVWRELAPPIPWWTAHFGTGVDADGARSATLQGLETGAEGAIFHSRCEHLHELVEACRSADKAFAAPFHSQEPLSVDAAISEFEHQESLSPSFRKIAVRARTFEDALAIVEATRLASQDGGTPVVGAVFGQQRWARIALPCAGSSITFMVARQVANEVGGDDEQLQLAELENLLNVRGLMPLRRAGGSAEDARAVA